MSPSTAEGDIYFDLQYVGKSTAYLAPGKRSFMLPSEPSMELAS